MAFMIFMKQLFLSFSFLLLAFVTFSQDHTVRGFVYDTGTGEAISFQQVNLIPTDTGRAVLRAQTDVNGFFSVPSVPIGLYVLEITVPQFKQYEREVKVTKKDGITDIRADIAPEGSKDLDEFVVSADTKRKKNEVLMSQIKLDKAAIERIPSMGAENDIVGAFSVTPGVVTTGDQGGQMYVRGGTPIQNKVLLDGMTIYNPFHSIGFFSIFETELVKNMDIYTGGFDAKYGGRISSIMDITYRDGNKKEFGGKVSASPFLAKAVIEGPLYRSKREGGGAGSYIFSAKHSLLDYTAKELYRDVNQGNGLPYKFTDVYGKITLASGGGSKFSFFGFHNTDAVNYTDIANLNFKQTGGGMSFVLVPQGSPIFIRGHLNGSSYETHFEEAGSQPRTSSIGGVDLGFDFTYFRKNEGQIDYGININLFNTNYLTYNDMKSEIKNANFTTEIGAYFNYKIVTSRWVIQPGFRAQVYASLGTISPEPRLGLKYNATEKFRLKLAGGRYSQNFTSASSDKDVVNLFNGLLSAPTSVQSTFVTPGGKERSPKNGIQYSWHAIIGGEYDLNKFWSFNLEGYYKFFPQLSNINTNKIYNDVSENNSIDDVFKKDFLIESGVSYGADLLVKYSRERIFFWGVYSYGKSTRWDGFDNYAPVFDRRHNVNLVGTYLFGKKKDLELNVRWNLGSGLPFTPTAGFYQPETVSGGVTTDYTSTNSPSVGILLGGFNSKRLPYYHRMDITVKKRFEFKNKTELEIIGSITNVYNRKNIFYVNRVTNQVIYQFPILPSIGVNYKF